MEQFEAILTNENTSKQILIPLFPEQNIDYENESNFLIKMNEKINLNELDLYLFQVHEEGGKLFLFSKLFNKSNNCYQTVCVVFLEQCYELKFLPKKGCLNEAFDEIKNLVENNGQIKNISVMKKKFVFDENEKIPEECDWICADFSSDCDLTKIAMNGTYYEKVFGLSMSLTECFNLRNRIYGPTWIHVKNLITAENEITTVPMWYLKDKNSISLLEEGKMPLPNFNICLFSLRTYFNHETQKHEILMISLRVMEEFNVETFEHKDDHRFTFSRKTFDNFKMWKSSTEIISDFFDLLNKYDIDIVCSYGLKSDWNLIFKNLLSDDIIGWWKCGRIKRGLSKPKEDVPIYFYLCGIIQIDLKLLCNEMIKCSSSSFSSIVKQELNQERQSLEPIDIIQNIENQVQLKNLIDYNERDTFFVLKLLEKFSFIPLTIQLANLSGCPWGKVLQSLTNLRCEWLFMHTFSSLDYIIPDKILHDQLQKKTIGYKGGLVLEPKKGFYDNCVVLLDYNSLYPSVICEFNICFTTLRNFEIVDDDCERIKIANKTKTSEIHGVLPLIMKKLLYARKDVKNSILKSDNELIKARLTIKQKAIKILTNAMYGYLGYPYSRFSAKHIAEMITSLGRYILTETVNKITKYGYNIIYGDTDSVMVLSNTKDWNKAKDFGEKLASDITSEYQCLNLDVENIFIKLLLANKKKYAALVLKNNIDFINSTEMDIRNNSFINVKGIEIINKNWCNLMKYAGMFCLDQFMFSSDKNEAANSILKELKRINEMIRNNGESSLPIEESCFKKKMKITLDDLIIFKSITKPLDQYDSRKAVNVTVAKWMIKHGYKVSINEAIPYIMINNKAKDFDFKAVHPDNPIFNNVEDTDIEWYLGTQVLPPIIRLCEIFGAPSKLDLLSTISNKLTQKTKISINDIIFKCPSCGYQNKICNNKVFTLICQKCKIEFNWKYVSNDVVHLIRDQLKKMMSNSYMCKCKFRTSQLSMKSVRHKLLMSDNICTRELFPKISNLELYQNLKHFYEVFQFQLSKEQNNENNQMLFSYLSDFIDDFIKSHGLSKIKLTTILSIGNYE